MTDTTAEIPEDYDAHETLKPAEPSFTLQGGDKIAPATIQFYAEETRARARGILNGAEAGFQPSEAHPEYTPTPADMAKAAQLLARATSAEAKSWDFQAYQRGDIEPEERRVMYNDTTETVTVAEMDERKERIKAVNQLNNSIAIAADCATNLGKLQIEPEAEVIIREAVELLRQSAIFVDPRRGNERS